MQKPDRIRLQHMLDAAEEALNFAGNCQRKDLEHNRMLVLALVKELEIIGEAANHLSEDGRVQVPGLPWLAIIGMRNRLVHAYFEINLDVLWQTIEQDLPVMVKILNKALQQWPLEM